MKILQVNQYYYPRGGADKYFLDLVESLTYKGHRVAVFSMQHPKNLESEWSKYFVSRISFNKPSLRDKFLTPGRVIYSLEAKRKFTKLLNDFKPDIIHIHNIYHHLSPSILDAAKKMNIPVVMHLHDYKLICPNHMLFTKGKICTECQKHKYYKCVKNKCVKNSFPGSLLAATEMYLHHNILSIYEKNISAFIAPSQFIKNMAVNFGQDKNKISVIYNPHNLNPYFKNVKSENIYGDYMLYFGRLSEEKGLKVLIEASSISKQKILIAGGGPEETKLKKMALDLKAPVEFIGLKNSDELINIVSNSKAVIIPSIWNENMPLSLMEALSLNKIVIASNIGGLPEIVKDEENGFLFEAGNSQDLGYKINLINTLSPEARKAIEENAGQSGKQFSFEKNLKAIINVYNQVTKNRG